MRLALLVALCLVSLPALADVYNLAVTMAPVSGAANCKLYIGSAGQVAKPCGSAQSFPAALPTEGTYSFSYSGVSASGLEGARGPAVSIVIDKTPGTPTNPPAVTVRCRDAGGTDVTCPSTITITPIP